MKTKLIKSALLLALEASSGQLYLRRRSLFFWVAPLLKTALQASRC